MASSVFSGKAAVLGAIVCMITHISAHTIGLPSDATSSDGNTLDLDVLARRDLASVYSSAIPSSASVLAPLHYGTTFTFAALIIPPALLFLASTRLLFPIVSALGLGSSSSTTDRSGSTATPRYQAGPPKAHPLARLWIPGSFSTTVSPGNRFTKLVFSTSITLSGFLVQLLICELTDVLEPGARSIAFRICLYLLLTLILVLIPILQLRTVYSAIHSSTITAVDGLGKQRFRRPSSSSLTTPISQALRSRSFVAFQFVGLAGFLAVFWYIGGLLVSLYIGLNQTAGYRHSAFAISHSFSEFPSFREGTLERIGVLGITLMGALSGFAGVSNIWQNFGSKPSVVTEADLVRRRTVLQVTAELLAEKEARLRALSRKLVDTGGQVSANHRTGYSSLHNSSPVTPSIVGLGEDNTPAVTVGCNPGLFNRLFTALRTTSMSQEEVNTLEVEIAHLEETRMNIGDQLYSLQARYDAQTQAEGVFSRVMALLSFVLAVYCVFRVAASAAGMCVRAAATSHVLPWSFLSATASSSSSTSSFTSLLTEPISLSLALVTQRWESSLTQDVWRRHLAFLPSGLMLIASLNSILQTIVIFARISPQLIRLVRQNAVLMIGQLGGIYVISAAVLLRVRLPVGSDAAISSSSSSLSSPSSPFFFISSQIADLLNTPLEAGPVDAWFESCFLLACAATAAGIWLVRQLSSTGPYGPSSCPTSPYTLMSEMGSSPFSGFSSESNPKGGFSSSSFWPAAAASGPLDSFSVGLSDLDVGLPPPSTQVGGVVPVWALDVEMGKLN